MQTKPSPEASEILSEDGRMLLRRARRGEQPILIRTFRGGAPTPRELARMHYGAELCRDLDVSGIVKVIGIEDTGRGPALLMEDPGGRPLSQLLATRRLAIAQALQIGIQIARTLGELHGRGIIHKDVKPANVIADLETGQVRLVNFDIASRLAFESAALDTLQRLEGTLAYISPEQTGRMNRAVDYRTDLYSLGVTLYELVTGHLPFPTSDPVALVHSHIAVDPTPPHRDRPDIPAAISSVVMKLMAKNPEDRYQSAYGLVADLTECLRQLEAAGTVAGLVPGERDVAAFFRVPERVYGRAAESAALLAAFERVSDGPSELVLVTGYAGIGKSTLVNEIHRPMITMRGYFGAGKFDQLQGVPYGAFIRAFRSIIRHILTEPDARIASFRAALSEALDPIGGVLTAVIPELAFILGPQPALPSLGPSESRNRWSLAFRRLLGVLASADHPLALFLDDLQWADSGSLDLLQLLLGDPNSKSILVIGAYRDNEMLATHPAALAFTEIRKGPSRVTEIHLAPLRFEDVDHMIADTLGGHDGHARRELSALIHQKAEGNPFFVKQLLTMLHARGLLAYDPARGSWSWSRERIEAERVTDNIAALMADRIRKLSAGARRALELASCLGATFDLRTLTVLAGRGVREVADELWEAVEAGLVLPVGDTYKHLAALGETGPGAVPLIEYRFVHDRIQEAAYALLAPEERRRLHLAAGRFALADCTAEQREERIFDIVNQLNLAGDLVDTRDARLELARLNLAAGRKARASQAHASAAGYLRKGLDLLPADGWESEYDLAFALRRQRAECDYVLGRHDEAESTFQELVQQARTKQEKIDIYVLQMALFTSNGKYEGSMRAGREGMRVLGVEIPPDEGLPAAVEVEMAGLLADLEGRRILDLVGAPEARDPDERARILFLSRMNLYGSYNNPYLFQLLAMMLVRRTIAHGNAPGSSPGFATCGMLLGAARGDHRSAYDLGQVGLALSERLDDQELRAMIALLVGCFIDPWRRPVRESFPLLERAFRGCLESGSMAYAGASAVMIVWLRFIAGEELHGLLERARQHFELQISMNVRDLGYFIAAIMRGMILIAHGALPEAYAPWEDERAFVEEQVRYPPAVNAHHVVSLQVAYLFGDLSRAEESAAKAGAGLSTNFSHIVAVEHSYYHGLLLAALLAGDPDAEASPERRRALDEHLAKLARWAEECPENFRHKHLLVSAEAARVAGKDGEAMGLYDRAVEAAEESGYVQHQALGCELAGRFHLARGRRRVARAYLADARHAYARWGAGAKVADLDRRHGELLREGGVQVEKAGEGGEAALDLDSVMRATQAISGEIVLEDLLRKLMRTMLENAGAQRGFLLLSSDGELLVEASQEGDVVSLHAGPLESRGDLSRAIVRYVARTHERIVLDNASHAGHFESDPYLAAARVKSVLCMPIIKQKALAGVLYLENNLVAQAFTAERCRTLELLAAQAAISLENARLYDTLEDRVKARTRELNKSNEDLSEALRRLKETQKQLIMQEKLASLGAMTSGIAHEIRNPLHFIINFAELSSGLARDVEAALGPYRGKIAGDDLDEIQATLGDLDENVTRIREHGRRLDNIVSTMLLHARNTPGKHEPTDLNALVAGSVNLATHGLRGKYPSFFLEIRADYDPSVGHVPLSPQEMSRVFINIINNAAYATQEKQRRLGPSYTPALSISTRAEGDRVEVRIRDNGTGIPADVLARIWNPFFTTKPAGEGTGLGLSISHDIVHGHRGEVRVETEPGEFTEFIITLPRRPPEPDARATSP